MLLKDAILHFLVELEQERSFIEATRDTGYKSTGSAIAELIDNALEADASHVNVVIQENANRAANIIIRVIDDGVGMSPAVLRLALQFGGSTRFGSRMATGRYGMGLPNGGLSQARRLEVLTWTNVSRVWSSYLDVERDRGGFIARGANSAHRPNPPIHRSTFGTRAA